MTCIFLNLTTNSAIQINIQITSTQKLYSKKYFLFAKPQQVFNYWGCVASPIPMATKIVSQGDLIVHNVFKNIRNIVFF